ncbi:MAG: hypothetical protein IKD55_00825 [Sediminibacterium sp.]|nr:hypothetical protein [Sediminibacterium sp.]
MKINIKSHFQTMMIKKYCCLLMFFICIVGSVNAQETKNDSSYKKKSTLISFERLVIIGHDFENRMWLCLGGSQLLFKLDDKTKFGPAYFPTVWWDTQTGEVDTKLGLGFRVDRGRWIVGFNSFRVKDIWVGTMGAGIKF